MIILNNFTLVRPDCLNIKVLIEESSLDLDIKAFLLKKVRGYYKNLAKLISVIHVLLVQTIVNCQYGYKVRIPIPFKRLAQITGLGNSKLRRYILNSLVKLKIIKIKRFKSHPGQKMYNPKEGSKCYEYKLCPPYSLKSGAKLVPFEESYCLSDAQTKAILGSVSERVQAKTDLEMYLLKNVQKIRLHPSIYDYLETMEFDNEVKRLRAKMLVDALNAENKLTSYGMPMPGWFFSRHPNIKRVYSTLTAINGEIREQFLYLVDDKLFEVDQHASQPFLMLVFYRTMIGDKEEIKREAQEFYSLWKNKCFYKDFAKLAGAELSEDDMKQAFIVGLNAKSWRYPPAGVKKEVLKVISDTLKKRFPLLYGEIARLKNVRNFDIAKKLKKARNGEEKLHSQFGIKMQQNEAEIFIDGIAQELMDKGIFFYPVHDCIGCLEKDMPVVRECMSRHLREKIGFEPVLK
jgi:uncharacterized protein (DUF2164 family)